MTHDSSLSELRRLVKEIIKESMTPEDQSHIQDVLHRIIDEEIEVPGVYTQQQAEEWVRENETRIIELGRDGYNPFDTVDIILGNETEDDHHDWETD